MEANGIPSQRQICDTTSPPEPWPQVNEADYEAVPTTTPETATPAGFENASVTPATVTTGHGLSELDEKIVANDKLDEKIWVKAGKPIEDFGYT